MTSFEKQLYDLLIEIKEDQAALSAMFSANQRLYEEQAKHVSTLEEKVAKNTRHLVSLTSSLKAWWAASAALGSILGWLLSNFSLKN